VILADTAATERAGARLAALVRGGDAIALIGDLGAGKTTLTSGLVAALGGEGAHSPTFSLVHQYTGGRLLVWHADLYRLEREAELIELGLDEVFGDRRGLVIVEWANNFPVMPHDHLRLELRHTPTEHGDQRELVATGTGPRGRELATAFDTSSAHELG